MDHPTDDPMPERTSGEYLDWMKRRIVEILEADDFDTIQRMFEAAHGETHPRHR